MRYSFLVFILVCFVACGQPRGNKVITSAKNPIPDSVCSFFPTDEIFYTSKLNPLGLSQKCTNPSMCCKYLLVVSKDNLDF